MSELNDFSNLNLYVALIPPIKFQLNPTYGLFKFYNPVNPMEWNYFSNSKSPCHSITSDQVWAQSDLGFMSRCGLKIFKVADLYVALMPPIKLQLNPTYGLGGDVV